MNSRNFEYFGEDPFLASRMAVNYIEGVQSQGVSATVKHFLGNNSDFGRHKTDSIIDERTLREIYLPAFEAAVKEAHVGAVVDSYNLTNGAHMTQNGYFNNDVLKKEWGFLGILMSDWGSTHDTVAAANGGLDLEMPSGSFPIKKCCSRLFSREESPWPLWMTKSAGFCARRSDLPARARTNGHHYPRLQRTGI
jgi:beta-glucosidase